MIQQITQFIKGVNPGWIKITKSYPDLSVASLTNDIELYSLPAGGAMHNVFLKHSASFTGGLISAYTLSVGVTGNLVKYAAAFNVFQAVSDTAFPANSPFLAVENWGAATSIRLSAVSVTGLLNTSTQGSVDVYLLTSKIK